MSVLCFFKTLGRKFADSAMEFKRLRSLTGMGPVSYTHLLTEHGIIYAGKFSIRMQKETV